MQSGLRVFAAAVAIALLPGFANSVIAQSSVPSVELLEKWTGSGHADVTSPAFTHWNDEGEIPPNCATCHTGEGFRAFYGLDGSVAGTVEHPIPIGGVVDCETCHNDAIDTVQSVTFPSGVVVPKLGTNATCMTCHQGRQSTVGIDVAIADMSEDKINPELTFINVHYKAAAATLLGTEVKGGYEYEGKTYVGRFAHVPTFATCSTCHDPHSLEVKIEDCSDCHKTDAPQAIRTSSTDFDADGDVTEGISFEIASLHEILGTAITAYANTVSDAPLIYDTHQYPYFFNDKNKDGQVSEGEAIYPNRYTSWTPRLLKAAYNYQFIAKDPGAYAHNPHYAMQLLFDSIESLSHVTKVDVSNMKRP